MSARVWARDLTMGVRFAVSGGREGWVRALLTAVGVGLGVAMLLLTTAIPHALELRDAHENARADISTSSTVHTSDATVVVAHADTEFRGHGVRGRELEAEGPGAPLPPGVAKFPAQGEMVVSPALKDLLASDSGALLRKRLPGRIVATIGDNGLAGPRELAFYRGAEGLASHIDGDGVHRIKEFGDPSPDAQKLDPIQALLILVMLVVLLMPVAVFIATAVRFGSERRDRRLAALRLVGSDSRSVRRVAAGEALVGALLGLLVGAGFFVAGRQAAGSFEIRNISVFPDYLSPSPFLALLVVVAVPVAAVAVTVLALRNVAIEPLGVVRSGRQAKGRLWWRLLPSLIGLALLAPMMGKGRDNGQFSGPQTGFGVILLLIGVTALLPWVVGAVVARLGSGGGVAQQLAVRRLQMNSGAATSMVNGIAVAVAGAIALQMLFGGVEASYTHSTGLDTSRAQMEVTVPGDVPLAPATQKLRATEGVKAVVTFNEGNVGDRADNPRRYAQVSVGDCADLREIATLPSCRPGDAFLLAPGHTEFASPDAAELARPGKRLYFDPAFPGAPHTSKAASWSLPRTVKTGQPRSGLAGTWESGGILITRAALPDDTVSTMIGHAYVRVDGSVKDAGELVRNTVATIDPRAVTTVRRGSGIDGTYAGIRSGLLVGAACVLALIGLSLLVTQLEQLRERKKLLSALVAFGTRRRTLSMSVLWQTAIPVLLGLALATVVGLALGAVLLKMTAVPVTVDLGAVLAMVGAGAAVVAGVTLLSIPPLLRMMRPEGLRTE
ncbi:ABC transporter permease [Streptomyces sp. NBC_00178]|uniref:ABC transporter permease n=1 Tax=Streptomyces sp. NBC_00178 TaxID=2975672 RepID=UPI002E28C725|nr:FtsX-like permease family protein [Streptomyces sp. NBC_00178]